MMIMTGMTMAFKLGIMGYWDYGGNEQYEDDDNNFNFEKDNQLDDDGGDNDVDANDCELANMQWQSVSRWRRICIKRQSVVTPSLLSAAG